MRDPDALVHIENSYGALMKRIAVNLRLGRRDTEECMNDTFLEVWNTIPPAKPSSIRSYVCMLMRRIVVDRIRYNSAGKRSSTVYLDVMDEVRDISDVENTVIDRVCLPSVLNSFLEKQSPENREIFIRRYYEFESARSIGADLLISSGTVDKRLSRMRKELKQMLIDWGYYNE